MNAILLIIGIAYGVCRIVIKSVQQFQNQKSNSSAKKKWNQK
jgi:F0F1-type ATP synthase assembly protein I